MYLVRILRVSRVVLVCDSIASWCVLSLSRALSHFWLFTLQAVLLTSPLAVNLSTCLTIPLAFLVDNVIFFFMTVPHYCLSRRQCKLTFCEDAREIPPDVCKIPPGFEK